MRSDTDSQSLYSTSEAARRLGVPKSNIHYWISRGQLDACAEVVLDGTRHQYLWTDEGLRRIAELAGVELDDKGETA